MVVSLYTSRVVLDVLGIEDYGLYGIVGGIVVLLSIVSNSMTSATQRFITYELGNSTSERVSDVFSMSLIAHIIICFVVVLLGETIGLWYLRTNLNIPEGREVAANIIYQISLISVVINLIRSPYNASVIAHEKMSFFAYMSIIDVTLKLAIVFILIKIPFDKLVSYSLLILATNVVVLFCYRLYCGKKFDTCNFRFIIEKDYFKRLFSFLGWNVFGATASLGTQQAGNLIINKFVGVAVNAAFGVANQVNGVINGFVSSFQVAYTPQIVKLYSQKRMEQFYSLSSRAALLSFYLLFLVAFPILLRIDDILSLWLVEVPQYAGSFCALMIAYSLIDAIQAPFWIGINATGDIKFYEIWLSLLLILNIPFSILALRMGLAPYWVLIIRVALNAVSAILRCIHVRVQLLFPIRQYLTTVVARASLVVLVSFLLWRIIPHQGLNTSIIGLLLYYLVCLTILAILIWLIGMSKGDKSEIINLVKSFFSTNESV